MARTVIISTLMLYPRAKTFLLIFVIFLAGAFCACNRKDTPHEKPKPAARETKPADAEDKNIQEEQTQDTESEGKQEPDSEKEPVAEKAGNARYQSCLRMVEKSLTEVDGRLCVIYALKDKGFQETCDVECVDPETGQTTGSPGCEDAARVRAEKDVIEKCTQKTQSDIERAKTACDRYLR